MTHPSRPRLHDTGDCHTTSQSVSGSTLTAVGRFQLPAQWPGTHSGFYSGSNEQHRLYLGVYLKRTCSRVTSASSALGVLNDYALCKSTHSLTQSVSQSCLLVSCSTRKDNKESTHTRVTSSRILARLILDPPHLLWNPTLYPCDPVNYRDRSV